MAEQLRVTQEMVNRLPQVLVLLPQEAQTRLGNQLTNYQKKAAAVAEIPGQKMDRMFEKDRLGSLDFLDAPLDLMEAEQAEDQAKAFLEQPLDITQVGSWEIILGKIAVELANHRNNRTACERWLLSRFIKPTRIHPYLLPYIKNRQSAEIRLAETKPRFQQIEKEIDEAIVRDSINETKGLVQAREKLIDSCEREILPDEAEAAFDNYILTFPERREIAAFKYAERHGFSMDYTIGLEEFKRDIEQAFPVNISGNKKVVSLYQSVQTPEDFRQLDRFDQQRWFFWLSHKILLTYSLKKLIPTPILSPAFYKA